MYTFQEFWKDQFYKSLNIKTLRKIREIIIEMEADRIPSREIISYLQENFSELSELWKAERAYWTEVKKLESNNILNDAEDLGIQKFRIVPSPNACPLCKKVSGNGKRIFTKKEIDGVLPIHPNCYCTMAIIE
jgi:hypothetical protein